MYVLMFGFNGTFLEKEHWIGLDNIFKLTNHPSTPMTLKITMEDFSGNVREAYYNSFRIEDGSDKYRLRLGNYTGTAGDAFSYHNNNQFSTKDQDNDNSRHNCATYQGGDGGYWYKFCLFSNLNGPNHADGIAESYGKGIVWYTSEWSNDRKRSLKSVTMSIRPKI